MEQANGSRSRRERNPENWKQTLRKTLRQAGKKYLTTSGQVARERRLQEPCGPTCHLRCTERIDEASRQHVHNIFWRLTDEQKNNFYWKYTSKTTPKRRRDKSEVSQRVNRFCYSFELPHGRTPVCGKFFLATLDITSRRIYYFYKHCYQADIGMPGEIKRGKNCKRKVNDLQKKLDVIREHIQSLQAVEEEDSGGKRGKSNIIADVSVTRLYQLYTECTEEALLLKKHWYAKIFKEEFNGQLKIAKCTSSVGVQTTAERVHIEKVIQILPPPQTVVTYMNGVPTFTPTIATTTS